MISGPGLTGMVACCLVLMILRYGIAATPPADFVMRHSSIACGTFSVAAETDVSGMDFPLTSQGRSQVLRLKEAGSRSARHLDLDQHLSRDHALHGMLALDALASTWHCFRSAAGKDYLFVSMICTNESAVTCLTEEDVPGSDWTEIYDDAGKRVIKGHHGAMTKWDERRLRSRGLWPEFVRSTAKLPTKFVYGQR